MRAYIWVSLATIRSAGAAGASGAFMIAMGALVDPGDEVLIPDPCYPCNRHFVAAFDGIPELVPVGPAQRFQITQIKNSLGWCARQTARVRRLAAEVDQPRVVPHVGVGEGHGVHAAVARNAGEAGFLGAEIGRNVPKPTCRVMRQSSIPPASS